MYNILMYYNSKNLNLAKKLRSNMTKEEVKLWNILRAKRFYGYKFKRQVLIGNYIVDFLCPDKKLVIEVDGGQHNSLNDRNKDVERTKYIESQGYTLIRFWNNDVWNNIDGVCEEIKKVLEVPSPSTSLPPLPREVDI